MDIISAFGLGSAAGLNAYIPLLTVGLLQRYTDLVQLPGGWAWLGDGWMLTLVGVLAIVEFVADKIPVVDSINDMVQTVVRPAAGGMVFTSGFGGDTAVTSGGAFADGRWALFIAGAIVALIVHGVKATARPVVNASSAGIGAPVLSFGEDATSLALSISAIFLPLLALALVLVIVGAVVWWRKKRRRIAAAARRVNLRASGENGRSRR